MTFGESSGKAKRPRSKRDNCENHTEQPWNPEVIFLNSCHKLNPPSSNISQKLLF